MPFDVGGAISAGADSSEISNCCCNNSNRPISPSAAASFPPLGSIWPGERAGKADLTAAFDFLLGFFLGAFERFRSGLSIFAVDFERRRREKVKLHFPLRLGRFREFAAMLGKVSRFASRRALR